MPLKARGERTKRNTSREALCNLGGYFALGDSVAHFTPSCQLGTSRATRAAFLKGGNEVGGAAEQKSGRSSGQAYRAG
jgi:hypothetical protein